MFKLIKFLITGKWCNHKWEIHEQFHVTGNWCISYTRYILRCPKCGEMKLFKSKKWYD